MNHVGVVIGQGLLVEAVHKHSYCPLVFFWEALELADAFDAHWISAYSSHKSCIHVSSLDLLGAIFVAAPCGLQRPPLPL